MASYPIGAAEALLGVSAAALRHWEKEIPFLAPRKDAFGRREYSGRDLRVLLRLKHLLYARRFTIEGARDQLLAEMAGPNQDLRAVVDAARADLVASYLAAENLRRRAAAVLREETT